MAKMPKKSALPKNKGKGKAAPKAPQRSREEKQADDLAFDRASRATGLVLRYVFGDLNKPLVDRVVKEMEDGGSGRVAITAYLKAHPSDANPSAGSAADAAAASAASAASAAEPKAGGSGRRGDRGTDRFSITRGSGASRSGGSPKTYLDAVAGLATHVQVYAAPDPLAPGDWQVGPRANLSGNRILRRVANSYMGKKKKNESDVE
jgi:hypothetical protein